MSTLAIAVAGGVGALVRFFAEYAVRRHHPALRPWATVGVNALGCLIAGWISYQTVSALATSLHEVLLTGFCGGLTTFSSAFAIPVLLQREHHWGYAAAVVIATPLLCALAFALGASLGGV